jgi:hypothetical protein
MALNTSNALDVCRLTVLMGGVSGLERREQVPKPVEIDIQWLSRHVMRDLAMGDYARYLPFPPSRLTHFTYDLIPRKQMKSPRFTPKNPTATVRARG